MLKLKCLTFPYIEILKLTSAGQEDFDGDILQQVLPRKNGPNFRKVPFPMQMVAVFQHLKSMKKSYNRLISKIKAKPRSLINI